MVGAYRKEAGIFVDKMAFELAPEAWLEYDIQEF